MNQDFISKLETKHYLIGSFDTYINQSKKLIKENLKTSDKKVEEILKSMPTAYRAAIVDKKGGYIGYIGLFHVDQKNQRSSIRFEVVSDIKTKRIKEILHEFKNYLIQSLNIKDIDEFIYQTNKFVMIDKKEITPTSYITIPNQLLVNGIAEKTLEKFSKDYSIPKLQMPFTIKSNDRIIGIVGLSNLIWSNKRANLNIFLDKSLGSDIVNELSGYLIDDYIHYVHEANIHNITLSVNGSNHDMIDLLNKTKMSYYGQIPFGAINNEKVESNLMFQHIPNMEKQNGIFLFENPSVSLSLLDTDKKELSSQIHLGNGFRLVSPKLFESMGIDTQKIINDHIKAMQNREKFTIPLGEDKYFLQKGNEHYGIAKALMNYSYIILGENDNYSGYINILRENACGKNAEIEAGITPSLQHNGLGTMIVNRFYDELFSLGYASVTSAVFAFNTPSLKMCEKISQLRGIRLDSYYINGKLWDMNFYSKTNPLIEEQLKEKVKR